jgi:tetratricopeptide (TPR) repeat protein
MKALACYDRLLEFHPDHVTALYHRARIYQELKRDGEAETGFRRVLELRRLLRRPGSTWVLL